MIFHITKVINNMANGFKSGGREVDTPNKRKAKDKGIVIPLEYRGQNILRFENRLMSYFIISQVIDKQ